MEQINVSTGYTCSRHCSLFSLSEMIGFPRYVMKFHNYTDEQSPACDGLLWYICINVKGIKKNDLLELSFPLTE